MILITPLEIYKKQEQTIIERFETLENSNQERISTKLEPN